MPASKANCSDYGSQIFTYSKGSHRKGINLRHRKSRRLSRVKSSYHLCQEGQDFVPNMRWVFEGFINAHPQGKGRFPLKVKGLRTSEALRMFRKSYTMGFDSELKPIRKSKLY